MMLYNGIKVYLAKGLLKKNRLQINSGTETASLDAVSKLRCCPDSLLPKENWRELTDIESDRLYTDDPIEFGRCIGVIQIDVSIIDRLVLLGLPYVTNKDDLDKVETKPSYSDVRNLLIAHLEPYLLTPNEFVAHRISILPAGLKTSTYDPQNKCYVGLHLDNWYNDVLSYRAQSNNRICINLGMEDRYLLFVNLELKNMLDLLDNKKEEQLQFYEENPGQVGYDFLQRHNNYPVVKLLIRPGEAYIAPTENLIHDGCTTGKTQPDISLTFRGCFKVSPIYENN